MARFTNQAQLRYGDEVTNSDIVVGEIREVRRLPRRQSGRLTDRGIM